MTRPLLEVCVADPASLEAAIAGGADQIELCSALELGGLTATPGLMALAAGAPIPVRALIRPRSGDFVYGEADIAAMLADIAHVRTLGLAGVVLGASLPDGSLNEIVLARLIAASAGMSVTLHRAVDLAPDLEAATETAVRLGFGAILTSGGADSAIAGADALARMVQVARGRIGIMPGAGLTPANVGSLVARVSVVAVHSSCSEAVQTPCAPAIRLGFAEATRKQTKADIVAAFKAALG